MEKYHKGELSAGQMHELEMQALNDPFLQDALDGAAYDANFAAKAKELENKFLPVENEERTAKVIPIFNYKKWLAAAGIIGTLGVGVYFLNQNFNQPEANIAKTAEPVAAESMSEESGTTLRDSNADEVAAVIPRQASVDTSTPASTVAKLKQVPADKTTEELVAAPANAMKRQSFENADAKGVDTGIAMDNNVQKRGGNAYFEGRITNEQGQPIAGANVYIPQTQTNVSTNNEGKFVISTNLEKANAEVSAESYAANKALLQKGENNFTLHKTDEEYKKDVNAAMTKRWKAENANPAEPQMQELRKFNVITTNIGSPDFRKYLQEKAKNKWYEGADRIYGSLTLRFDVSEKGRPVNIRIIDSMCEECDKQLIDLLKDGPDWEPNNKKGLKLIIRVD